MHAVVRTYSGKGSKKLIDVIEKNKTEVEGLLRAINGFVSYYLVPLHRGSDRLNVVHRRSGRCSGSTSNSMLRAILGFLLMNPARSSVNTIW